MRWWRAVTRIPTQFQLFRAFGNGWVKAGVKAMAITVLRRRVPIYPGYWL